jgi:phosphoribosylanthranilate isomerase
MNPTELDYALSMGADAVGFVVEIENSRHCISAMAAREMVKRVPVFVKSVAVIAPRDVDEAEGLAKKTGSDLLQVHGDLELKDLIALKDRISQKLIAAVPAGSVEAYSRSLVADAVLLDTFKNGVLGGTGEIHDWSQSAAMVKDLKVPVILAGGLSPLNVGEAIKRVRPYAVDVSSGVETSGRKDPSKIMAFIQEVRACP